MKIETKTVHSVDYNDLDEAINEFLKEKGSKKRNFEFCAEQEASNDSSYEFSVGKYSFDKVDEDDKQNILEGNFFDTGDILNWMHEENKIPAGDYIVKVSW